MLRRREQACLAGGIALLGWAAIGEATRVPVEARRPSPACVRRVPDPRLGVRCARLDEREVSLPGPVSLALGMRIDANVASKADLRAVPGIGPAIAERIVADRQAEGPFGGIEEIQRVKGIGPKRLELIRPYLRVGPRGSP